MHKHLLKKSTAYRRWHRHKAVNARHWAILLGAAFFALAFVLGEIEQANLF